MYVEKIQFSLGLVALPDPHTYMMFRSEPKRIWNTQSTVAMEALAVTRLRYGFLASITGYPNLGSFVAEAY